MRTRYVFMILGIFLPPFLHFMLYALDEHESFEVILGFFMVLHSLSYFPAVIIFGPGKLAWWFTLVLWGIIGYIFGYAIDKRRQKKEPSEGARGHAS